MPAVFFDRDDTLMRNVPYLGDPALVEAYSDAPAALAMLRDAGFLLFIVSNQSGVGRGLISVEQVAAVNEALFAQLCSSLPTPDQGTVSGSGAGWFREVYNCYSAPHLEPDSQDRKPNPGLLFRAAREHNVNLSCSYFIGDRISDIECALNAGATPVLVLTGTCDTPEELEQAKAKAHFVAPGLLSAAEWILEREKTASSHSSSASGSSLASPSV
ncbi:MAG: D-glycero-alpha-D-manno-heptose-1,7-bisphosphate 7-phosphatase [Candidatus Methylacidiphilales bacterium]